MPKKVLHGHKLSLVESLFIVGPSSFSSFGPPTFTGWMVQLSFWPKNGIFLKFALKFLFYFFNNTNKNKVINLGTLKKILN